MLYISDGIVCIYLAAQVEIDLFDLEAKGVALEANWNSALSRRWSLSQFLIDSLSSITPIFLFFLFFLNIPVVKISINYNRRRRGSYRGQQHISRRYYAAKNRRGGLVFVIKLVCRIIENVLVVSKPHFWPRCAAGNVFLVEPIA